MNWSIPEEIVKEMESLDAEKKEKVLRYILRENEVGRYPARDELLEIIHYLKGKTTRDSRKLSTNFRGENISIENEKQPSEYTKFFNCTFCTHYRKEFCSSEDSPLFQKQVNKFIVCFYYAENV